MVLQSPHTRFLLLVMVAPVALVLVAFFAPVPYLDRVAGLGRVPHDESMSAERWYGDAVDEIVQHAGPRGRIAEVSVYDRRIGVDTVDDGRIEMWAFDWRSPGRMAPVPSPGIPAGRTFSVEQLDRRAPERIMAEAARRAGPDVSISVLRLEVDFAGRLRWTLHGLGERGAVWLTARPDGSGVRDARPGA
jgi:hypothetical protein